MTPDELDRYIRGEYDPRYPYDFGWRHLILAGVVAIGLVGYTILF